MSVKPCGPLKKQPKYDTWNKEPRPAAVRGRYLYHVTIKKNVPSILQRGLVPRSPVRSPYAGNRRVKALFVSKKISSIIEMAQEDYDSIRPGTWYVLRIDTKKLPKLCLFHDHGMSDAEGWLWTQSKIPARAIKPHKQFVVKRQKRRN